MTLMHYGQVPAVTKPGANVIDVIFSENEEPAVRNFKPLVTQTENLKREVYRF